MKYITAIFALFFILEIGYSQDITDKKKRKVDSLINELKHKLPDSTRIDLNIQITEIFYLNDSKKALHYAKIANNIALDANIQSEILSTYNWVGYIYWQQGKLKEALYVYKKALKQAENGDKNDASDILGNIGYIYKDLGDLQKGLDYLEKGLKIREANKDSSGIGNSLNNIGLIYKALEEYSKALEYLEKSYEIRVKSNHKSETSPVLNNIAIIWATKGDLNKSREYLLQSLKVSQSNNDLNNTAMILNNLGVSFQKEGMLDSAELHLNKSVKVSRKIGSKYWESSALLHLGEIMLLKKKPSKAKSFVLSAYKLALETGHPERLRDISERLYEIYAKENDWKNAFKYHVEFIEMRDSIINVENKSQLFKHELKSKYEKKKLSDSLINLEANKVLNLQIEKEKATNENILKEKQQNLIWSIVAGIILFLAVFFLIRINTIRKKSNKNLSEKNIKINKTSANLKVAIGERDTLLKEIHHRVKNNLQTVSSLLSLQSRYLDDPNASKALEESRNRLLSISLLHQKLYQNDNLPVVELDSYIKELTTQIQETCNPHNKKIDVKIDCVDVKCDIEQAMPLGLIINELMTNAYKYAFKDLSKGIIAVKLSNPTLDNYILEVSDNGIGLPDGFSIKGRDSMGLNLVNLLTKQIKGTLITNGESGAFFSINFLMKQKYN